MLDVQWWLAIFKERVRIAANMRRFESVRFFAHRLVGGTSHVHTTIRARGHLGPEKRERRLCDRLKHSRL